MIATVDGRTSRRRKSSYVARSSVCDVYAIIQTAVAVAVAVIIAVIIAVVVAATTAAAAALVVNRQSLVAKER